MTPTVLPPSARMVTVRSTYLANTGQLCQPRAARRTPRGEVPVAVVNRRADADTLRAFRSYRDGRSGPALSSRLWIAT